MKCLLFTCDSRPFADGWGVVRPLRPRLRACVTKCTADIRYNEWTWGLSVCLCSNLIPKANAWLLENVGARLIKCETTERKLSTVDDITTDTVLFVPSDNRAIFIKGLRYVATLYPECELAWRNYRRSDMLKCLNPCTRRTASTGCWWSGESSEQCDA